MFIVDLCWFLAKNDELGYALLSTDKAKTPSKALARDGVFFVLFGFGYFSVKMGDCASFLRVIRQRAEADGIQIRIEEPHLEGGGLA